MQKPNGYDEVQISSFVPIALGGHYCQIKQVSEKTSSTGKPMIVVLFDFCAPDKQEGYFMASFKNDTREDKKWPFAGSKYIMVNDYQDPKKTSRQFKAFCTCVEKSNNYSIKWGEADWAQQFKGKKIGAVYGEEENEYNGDSFMRIVVKWFCESKEVEVAKVPPAKYLKRQESAPAQGGGTPGFLQIPEPSEDWIPF